MILLALRSNPENQVRQAPPESLRVSLKWYCRMHQARSPVIMTQTIRHNRDTMQKIIGGRNLNFSHRVGSIVDLC